MASTSFSFKMGPNSVICVQKLDWDRDVLQTNRIETYKRPLTESWVSYWLTISIFFNRGGQSHFESTVQ
jgi:hypothetical protein